MNVAVFSKRLIINGGTNIAGAAIPTLDGTTWLIAATAALPEAPAYSPSGVSIAIPCLISYHKKMRQLRIRENVAANLLTHERNINTVGSSNG